MNKQELEIPEGWKKVKLGEICAKIIDKDHMTPKYQNEGVPLVAPTNFIGINDIDLESCKFISMKDHLNNKRRTDLQIGDLLFSRIGTIGLVRYLDKYSDFSILHSIVQLRPNINKAIGKFLFYVLGHIYIKKQAMMELQSIGVPDLGIDKIKNFVLLLPPLPEQEKIAEILSTIDNAIDKTDKIIEKYKRIKQGLMQELLTKGVDENFRIRSEQTHKFKDSPLGRIPEEWRIVRLGDIGKIVSGSTPDTSKLEFWNGNIVWVTPDDLSKLENRYIFTSQRKITEKGLKNCSAKIIPSGSLVISSRAPIGYLAISCVNFTTNQGCKSINFNSNNEPEFFYYCLHRYIHKMVTLGSGTTFNEISKSVLENLEICVPIHRQEQKRIASILSQIDEAIEKEQKYKAKLERIKQGLMHDLLTGKVRVNKLIERYENVQKAR